MCDFASFFVRLKGRKVDVVRRDWRSHSLTAQQAGLVLTAAEEWSEAEWTGDGPEMLVVRHTDREKAMALRAAIVGEYPARADMLRAHAGDAGGWIADESGKLTGFAGVRPNPHP